MPGPLAHRPGPSGRTRRARRLALVGVALVGLTAGACDPEPTDAGRLDGLLVLTADRDGAATLRAWDGAGTDATVAGLSLPALATTWFAVGRAGVLVATAADGTMHLSTPIGPAGRDLEWSPVLVTDVTGEAPAGPFWFPTWDPEGGRFAALSGGLVDGGAVAVTLVDPTTATSHSIPLDSPLIAAPPAWVGADTLATVAGTSGAPVALLVDTATGVSVDGPSGDRLVATSADGALTATSDGAGAAVVVHATDAWLAGDGTSIGSVAPPGEGATAVSIGLDRTGDRVAIAWALVDGSIRVDVHDGTDGWRRVSSETQDDGARGAVVGWRRSSG